MKYVQLAFVFALTSCFDKTETASTVATSDLVSTADLSTLTYDAKTHSITLGLDYKACQEVKHSLRFGDVCAESYPRQCGATVIQDLAYDSTCTTSRHQDLNVSLLASQNEMYLRVSNKDNESLSVLIDKDGKVKAATTPP